MKAGPGRAGPWRALWLLILLQAVAFSGRFALPLVGQPVLHALGGDDLRLGVLLGPAFVLPFVVATPLFGWLADRAPVRGVVLGGTALSTAALAWSGFAAGWGDMLGSRVLLGLGEAAVAPAVLGGIAAWAPTRGAGLATALFAAAGPVGKSVALTGGGLLLAALQTGGSSLAPWRGVFLIMALINGVVGAGVALTLSRGRTEGAAEPSPPPASTPVSDDAWSLAAAVAGGVMVAVTSQTLGLWAPTVLARGAHLSAAAAGADVGLALLLAAPGSALLTGRWLDGAPAERVPARALRVALVALSIVPPLAAIFALGAASPWMQIACIAALAAAAAAAALASLRAVQLLSPAPVRGRLTAGFIAAVNLVGFGAGPPLVGALSRSLGHGPAALGEAAAVVMAATAGLGAGAIILLGRPMRS